MTLLTLPCLDTRQFDPSRPFWTENTAPNYTYSGLHGDFGDVAVDLDRHLEMFEHYARIFPNFRLDMLDLFTEISPLDRKGEGVVRSVMNYRQVNCPAGVLKKSTAEFRWMRLEGEGEARPGRLVIWECRTVAGGGDMGG